MAKYQGRDVTILRDLKADDEDFAEQFDPNKPKVVIQDREGRKVVGKNDVTAD